MQTRRWSVIIGVYFCAFALLFGCARDKEESPIQNSSGETRRTEKPAKPAPPEALILESDGRKLSIGATIEEAQAAFPKPPNSNPPRINQTLLEGQEHWGWETNKEVFDVYYRKGKVDWFSYRMKIKDSKKREELVDKELEKFGEPAENAEGPDLSVYSWERDDGIRIVLNLSSGDDQGVLFFVGYVEALQEQGMPIGNLETLVQTPTPSPGNKEKKQ